MPQDAKKKIGGSPDFDKVRKDLTQASHAPGYFYSSPEILQQEIEAYFMKDWLFVAREEEIAKPGDYITLRLVGEPIIVARDKNGDLNAYYNMCLHRGTEVAEGQGNTRAFKCPYHGWVYDLQGRLTGASHMRESEGFDISACRMRPLQIDTWRGSIFVCFDLDAMPLEKFIREFEKDFAHLHPERCKIGNKITMEMECNWKFIPENLMDFYHVTVLHAGSFGSKFSWSNEDIVLKERGGVTMRYKAGPPTPDAKPILGKMPWLEDEDYSFASHGLMSPNFDIFGRIDCVRPVITWPLSPSRCRLVIYHLFPEVFFDRPDIDEVLKIYRDYQLTVLNEDRSMVESMQKAMSSRGYVPGRMSVREKSIHHLINSNADRLFGKP